jgi:FkbM family methyltransferase
MRPARIAAKLARWPGRASTLKYELIRTPLERPALWLRHALGYAERRRHPELREIHLEERRIPAALRRLLRPGSNCIDVGCHYGSMLSRFCRWAPRGRHLAFEPVPWKVRFLRRRFPDVDVREMALSDRAGPATFYVSRRATGFDGLAPPGQGDFEPIEVACARLDDVLPPDRRFDVLKVDVEGAELRVFRGARETLARHRPSILFECGPAGPEAFGHTPGELHDLLTREAAYCLYSLQGFLGGAGPFDRAAFVRAVSEYPFQAFNWIALPADRAE